MPVYHNFPYGICIENKEDAATTGAWTTENSTLMDSGNIRNARFLMKWNKYETSLGVTDWTVWDRQMALAATHNITVHWTFMHSPTWATDPRTNGMFLGSYMADHAIRVWNRYGTQIKLFEIGNEDPFFGETDIGKSGSNYAEQAFPVACALRTAGFGGPIVMAGYTNYDTTAQISAWFTDLHQSTSNAAKIIDAYNFHFYHAGKDPLIAYTGKPSLNDVVSTIHSVASSFGYADKPIMCTETGYITHTDPYHTNADNVVTAAQQSDYLQKIFEYGRTSGGVLDHVYVYTMRSQAEGMSLTQNGTPLPAYYMIKDMAVAYPTWART